MNDAPELKPCPFCKGGETRIDPQGQTWRGQGYSDPICWRLVHFCKGILPDDYVTNRMELRARTQDQCIEAWNTRAALCTPTDERVRALEAENARHDAQLDAAEAKMKEAVGVLKDMRDDKTGYRHTTHFRRRAAVYLASLEGDKPDE